VCRAGRCETPPEELGTIPAPSAKQPGEGSLVKIALSSGRVVVRNRAYVPDVTTVPRSGGAPLVLGQGMDFAASPSSSDVWRLTSPRVVDRLTDLGGAPLSHEELSKEASPGGNAIDDTAPVARSITRRSTRS
jgi:hypothetical protein